MESLANPNLNVPELNAPTPPPQVTAAPAAPEAPAAGSVQNFDPMTGEPTAPPLATRVAQNSLAANKMNPGKGNWAANFVAGVQSALAGVSAIGEVPAGGGALYGMGKVAGYQQAQKQLKIENDRKDRELNMQQTNQDREYQLKLAENARQQVKSVADMSEHDQRMHAFTQDASIRNFQLAKQESDFRQSQLDREEALKAVGAKPLTVGGQESPAFDDLGKAQEYAQTNGLEKGVLNGYRSRIVYGADNKYHFYEVPDSGIQQYTLKDPSGKPVKITTDPLGALNYQEKVSQLQRTSAETNEKNAKAAKERADAGGNSLTDKAIVAADAFTKMQADPEYAKLPTDPETGRVDQESAAYKTLDKKYGVSDAYDKAKMGYNTSTGEPYLRALTASNPTMSGTVVGIGEGREDMSVLPRGKERKQYVDALNRAYPGYDEGEQKTYFAARKAYTIASGSGSPGYAINAGQAAFSHLADLQKMNTAESRIPGTKAYQDYQAQMTVVSDELAKFYGNTALPSMDAFHQSLSAVTNRQAAIRTLAGAMDTKMNEYQTQWNSAIPKYLKQSGNIPPMPGISKQAMSDRTKLLAPPDTHVWSAAAFKAANPKATDADVATAGAQMKAQGYTVGK